MRLALVIASDYSESPQLATLPRALEDADRFAAFLDEHDTEIEIEEFTANRDFPEQFEQSLREQAEQLDALIVYFAGCLVTAPGRDPSLILDGERLGAFALPRLRRMLEGHASRVLFIIDAVAVPRDDSSVTDVVSEVGAALGRRGVLNVLVNVQLAQGDTPARSSFTDLLLFCWETALRSDPSDSELTASELFELMRGEPAFSDFEAAEYFQGNHDFDLLADAAAEGELSEHESSGLRLAADSEPGVPLHAEARSNGGYGSAFVAPGKPASLPPLPLPPTTLPAPAVPLPALPTLPSPGQRLAVPVPAPSPAMALDSTPRPGNPIDQWLKSDALPPPVIAEAPGFPPVPNGLVGGRAPRLPIDSGLEEERTEPGESFAGIAEEATDESPPDSAPDTDQDPAETRQLSEDSLARIEAEALSAAFDGGFIDGEDTEVTEGFGPLAHLVAQANAQPLHGPTLPGPTLPSPPPTAEEPMPSFAFDGFDDDTDEAGAVAPRPPLPAHTLPSPDIFEGEAEAGLEQVLAEPPPYEVCLQLGDTHFESADYVNAAAEYEKALLHAPADQAGVVYGRLGAVSRARGDYDGAITNYEIALELLPTDAGPLQALTDLCVAQREFAAVEGYQRRFLEAELDPEQRRKVWGMLASLWREQAGDGERARAILLEWLAELPDDVDAHRQLIASHAEQGDHTEVISARLRLAELLTDPGEQAAQLVNAVGEICRELGDADYAVQIAQRALEVHPSGLAALDSAAQLLKNEERWSDLARIYEQVLQSNGHPDVQLAIGPQLGELYRDKLHAPERTITAYERVLEEDSTRVDLRRQLVELYTTRGEYALALSHCRRALKASPHDHELYRKVYALLDKVGEVDAAWNAAMVLDCLGEADINEQLVADAHRPNGLLAPKSSVPDDLWGHNLFSPEREAELSELLAAVADVAIESRAHFLKKKKRVPKLEADKRHDPHTSTTTLAKSLLWTSKLLSVAPPQLYVLDEVPGELSAVPVDAPSALASKSLARGLSLAQLAFLWGRHLTLFRPEHYLAVFYPTVEELGVLVRASLLCGECPGVSAEATTSEIRKLAKELRKKLHPGSYERLRAACRSFRPHQLDERVAHWLKTVELAGGRAGLLACGDVAVATELCRRHPVRGQTPEQDQVSDIMCFSVSDEYAKLRDRLGVRIT